MNNIQHLNRPVQLNWAGWETDTYKLGQAGWQISAEQDVEQNRIQIAINHPEAQVQGISTIEEFLFQDMVRKNVHFVLPVTLKFETMSREIRITTIPASNINFQPIDFMPKIMERKIQSLNDFANFTVLEIPKNEVYLHEANIDQILKMALQRQVPEQERIRQEMRRQQELKKFRLGTLHTELRLVA